MFEMDVARLEIGQIWIAKNGAAAAETLVICGRRRVLVFGARRYDDDYAPESTVVEWPADEVRLYYKLLVP